MITNEPKGGQYDTGFERCAEGWRLYVAVNDAYEMPWKIDLRKTMRDYNAHVRDCPVCIAMTGRFAE